MLIGFFLAQGLLVWICLFGVEARRVIPEHVIAQEETVIPVVVSNKKRFLSSYALRVMEYLTYSPLLGAGHLIGTGFVFRIPRKADVHASYRVIFPHRGIVTLKHLEIITRYPFGMAERAAVFNEPDEILVYPALADVTEAVNQTRADIGEISSETKGTGTDLYGLREYVPGENVRHVHWRSSAKADKLVLMEFEKQQRHRAILLLNNSVPADKLNDTAIKAEFEKSLIFTGSLARHLIEIGYEVQLTTDSGIIPFGSGTTHFYRIMRSLALIEIVARGTFHRIPPDSSAAIYQIIFAEGQQTFRAKSAFLFEASSWQIKDFKFMPIMPQ
jgi:uncharacterized protein (DUF58 family)